MEKNKKSTNTYLIGGLVVLLIAASFGLGFLWNKVKNLEGGSGESNQGNTATNTRPTKSPSRKVAPVTNSDHIRGNRKAQIALIEYSDLECPFCKRFHPTTKKLLEEFGDKLMIVYRHFPLTQLHSKAQKEAEATECVAELGGNDKFWAFVDKIFEVTPSNNGLDLNKLPELAAEVGVDKKKFQDCLDSGKHKKTVEDQFRSGIQAGVTGTPGNILLNLKTGETKLVPGAVPFETMKREIEKMLGS